VNDGLATVGAKLNALLADAAPAALNAATARKFEVYLSLILRWNARLNLTSVRAEDAIIYLHLSESVACAKAIPNGVRTLLDFGSGAGLPGIPIALCRPEIAVTLAESRGKKAAFLQEAVRVLGIDAKVYADRAEKLGAVFDCVVLRAVDKMPKAVRVAAGLVSTKGWLALMTTGAELPKLQEAAGKELSWPIRIPLPKSTDRIIAIGSRQIR